MDKRQRCEASRGYWVPDPEFLVTPNSKLRLLVYISNWMTIRLSVFSKLGRRTFYDTVSPYAWRTFIGRFPEMTEEERAKNEAKREAIVTGKAGDKSGKAAQPQQPPRIQASSSVGGDDVSCTGGESAGVESWVARTRSHMPKLLGIFVQPSHT